MKKILSLVLVLCMMVFAFSALAEQTTEAAPQSAESAQSGESSADSSEAMSKLFAESGESAEGTEGTEGQGLDMDAAMKALGATKMEDVKTVPADSADKFYGTFTVTKMVMNGYAFDLSVMMGAAAATPSLTISAEGVSTVDENGEAKVTPFTSSEFADGVLNVVVEGGNVKLSLLEDGNILLTAVLPGEEAVEMGLILAAAK